MALNLRDPDDYFSFLRHLGRIDAGLSDLDMPQTGVGVALWIPSVRADEVANEIAGLETDMRSAAAVVPWVSPRYRRRLHPRYFEELWEFGYPGGPWPFMQTPLSQPIDATEGGLEVVRATQGDSLDIDFQAIGLVLGMLVDTPTAFFWLRATLRRIPIRVTWRPSRADDVEPQIVDALPGGADEIEARRLIRRITLRYTDGSELIEEEFVLPGRGQN